MFQRAYLRAVEQTDLLCTHPNIYTQNCNCCHGFMGW